MSASRARGVPHTGEVTAVVLGAVVLVLVVVAALAATAGPGARSGVVVIAVVVLAALAAAAVVLSSVLARRWRGSAADAGRGGLIEPVPVGHGASLHSEADGADDAPLTVVLVHDLLLDLSSWRVQRRALVAAGARVVLYDQRGHGLSARTPLPVDRPGGTALADDLAAVIAARAPSGPLLLVGHGVGAMAVQSLAALRPDLFTERVAGTLLIGTATGPLHDRLGVGATGALARRWYPALLALTSHVPGGRAGRFLVQRLAVRRLAGHRGVTADVQRQVGTQAAAVAPKTAADFLLAALEHDARAGAAVLSGQPVVAVVPGADRFVPVADQAAMRASVPGVRIVRIADCGHAAPIERPDVISEQLRVLLGAVLPAGRDADPRPRTGRGAPAARTLADAELAGGDATGLLTKAAGGLLRTTRSSTDGLLAAPTTLPDLLQRPAPEPE